MVRTCFTPSNTHTAASVKTLSILAPVWLEAFPFSRQIRIYVTPCYSSYKWIQCPKYSGDIVVGAAKELHCSSSGQKAHPMKPRSADCHFFCQLFHRMAKCWWNFYKILLNTRVLHFSFQASTGSETGGEWCRKSPLLAYKSIATQIQSVYMRCNYNDDNKRWQQKNSSFWNEALPTFWRSDVNEDGMKT